MIDILVFLFAHYGNFESKPEPESLVRKLKAAGFEENDISVAMDWLEHLKPAIDDDRPPLPASDGFRLWTTEETHKFDREGLGFMAFLDQAGVLDCDMRERIVDRVLALEETPVPLAKLKIIALAVLWSHEDDIESLLVEELLAQPGQTAH